MQNYKSKSSVFSTNRKSSFLKVRDYFINPIIIIYIIKLANKASNILFQKTEIFT